MPGMTLLAETTEKLDPNNPEVMLVGGGLTKPALAAEASRYVESTDFQDKRLALIWSALVGMIESGVGPDSIDPISVAGKCAKSPPVQTKIAVFCGELRDSFSGLGSLVNAAQRIRRRATMRIALEDMRGIAGEIKEQLIAPDGEVKDLDARLAKLSIKTATRSDMTLRRTVYKDLGTEVSKYFDDLANGPTPTTIPIGLKKLDFRLGGGLRIGQLHTVLGCTGAGKTALAAQMCDAAVAKGKKALMFSMEVDPVDVYIRDVERLAGRSRWDLRSKYIATREAAQESIVMAQAKILSSSAGKVVYGEPMSVEAIRQAILTERLRSGGVDVVAVDHAQVALPSNNESRGMPRYLELKATAEGLRAIARQLNVAVILTAQLNPPAKGEQPTMEKVREGKDIINCSEVVMMIWHDKEETSDGDVAFTQSYIIVAKARTGMEGRIKVKYRGDIFRFESMHDLSEEGEQ